MNARNDRVVRIVFIVIACFLVSSQEVRSKLSQRPLEIPLPGDVDRVRDIRIDDRSFEARDASSRYRIRFSALGRDFNLLLEESSLFSPGARVTWVTDEGVYEQIPEDLFLEGRLEDQPSSQARLTVRGSSLEGIVVVDEEVYFLEPARNYFPGAEKQEVLAYRASDVEPVWDSRLCALHEASPGVAGLDDFDRDPHARSGLRSLVDEADISKLAQTKPVVELRLLVDSQYFRRYGSSSAS